jgi:NAD-dependent SIR2 family protein deacetylase
MIKNIIKNAEYIIITAGAGMGVDSGLPDFRGEKGLWKTSSGKSKSYMEMANPKLFLANPNEAWGFYGSRYNLYRETTPHKGFYLLKELVEKKKDYFIFTSNVDGHFQKAGFDKNKIVEIHGTITHQQCLKDCSGLIWSEDLNIEVKNLIAKDPLPKCQICEGLSRPNILMFGDNYWNSKRTEEQKDRMTDFISTINEKTVIIEIGAGTEIPTVRAKGEILSLRYKIPLIRINPNDLKSDLPCFIFPIKKKGLEGLEYITS